MNITENITFSGQRVAFTHPSWYCCAFDRNLIALKFPVIMSAANYIRLTVTTGGQTYQDLRPVYDKAYECDISGYLRAGFEISGQNPVRSLATTVKVEASASADGPFTTMATVSFLSAWGASRFTDYDASGTVRLGWTMCYWSGWPFIVEFPLRAYEDAEWTPDSGATYTIDTNVDTVKRITPSEVSAHIDLLETGDVITIKPGACVRNPVYLRWYDHLGLERYWLFEGGDVTLSAKDGKEVVPFRQAENSAQRYTVPISKALTRKQKLGVEFSEPWMRDYLEDLAGCPIVSMYVKKNNVSEYVPVSVTSTSIKSAEKGRSRYEIEISYELPTPAM